MRKWICGVVLGLAAATMVSAQQPPSEHIVGVGNFIHAVADVDRSLAFYRDTLGMDVQGAANAATPPAPRPFIATPEILRLYDSEGGQYRTGTALVQGAPMRAELIEFKDLERKPITRSLQDPGAGILKLTVRDIETAFTQAKFKGATVVTETGSPIVIKDEHGTGRAVLLKDPDGFYVELIQRDVPPPATAPMGNVIDVGFAVTVDDLDRTLHIFRDVLGFRTTEDPADHDEAMLSLLGIPIAFYGRQWAIVPGTSFQIDFIEVHGMTRRLIRPRPRDPGASILRLRVADIDKVIAELAKVDVKVVSTGAMPVTVAGAANTQRFAIAQTPDNFFVQVVQQIPTPGAAAAPR
jgi:catechol 2,3-dioxygenase-like lactoylglutathione lyase family enzyme